MVAVLVNDVIGAPEIVEIKGRIFWFSPLNDFEEACLEAWVRWYTDGEEGIESEEFATTAGAVQLLYQSIRRTEPAETVESLTEFVGIDYADAVSDIYDAWMQLNYSGYPQNASTTKPNVSATATSLSDVYVFLAKHYQWASPDVVSRMTKKQQLIYIEAIVGKSGDSLFFDTAEAYEEWRLANVK